MTAWTKGDLALCHFLGEWTDQRGRATCGIAPGRILTVRNVANLLGHTVLQFDGEGPHWFHAGCFTRIPPRGAVDGIEQPRRLPEGLPA